MQPVSELHESCTRNLIEMYICDRICENVHTSHIQFFNFEDSQNLLQMAYQP